MIKAPNSVKSINSFIDVAIPTPRDIFNRFGFSSSSSEAGYSCAAGEHAPPVAPNRSVISQMINASSMLENQVKSS